MLGNAKLYYFNTWWDPKPRTGYTLALVRVRAVDYEGSDDAMLGFAGHDPFDIE